MTKLVLQLVRRIPNAEPDEEVVKDQVKLFKQKLAELLKVKPKAEKHTDELKEDTSIAKLFEEVKIMFQDLPYRIDKRLDPEIMMRKRRKFHPKMMDELLHTAMKFEDPNISFLMMISIFKDELPWFYEIGLDTYRTLKNAKGKIEKQKAISSFNRASEMMGHPMILEMYARNEDTYILMKEMRHFIHHFIERLPR